MRITQPMITNRMLLNITRNAKNVDGLYNQIATGKKITFPSDNPILASRALKFRTNVTETEQYQRNVSQGLSWMEVTEGAFTNITNIMDTIRDLTERAASDTMTYEDRLKIITQIESLSDQVGLEMNVTYAGRYVFSGYRTDEPPVLTENNSNVFEITQYFTAKDVEYTKAYTQNLSIPGASTVRDVAVIKLAYTDLTAGGDIANAVSITDPNPYQPGNYIKETGEYVLAVWNEANGDTKPTVTPPASVTYTKTGFSKGELNPKIYFACTDMTVGSPTNGKVFNAGVNNGNRQNLELEFSVNTRVNINSSAMDVFTDKLYGDLQALVGSLKYTASMTADEVRDALSAAMPAGSTAEDLENAYALEMQKIQNTLQNRFKNMIGLADRHMSQISKEHTDMGTRMSRLELISSRLEDDRVSYTKLMSDNEDVDYMDALMNLNIAESIYQASLNAGANIMKITLADYI